MNKLLCHGTYDRLIQCRQQIAAATGLPCGGVQMPLGPIRGEGPRILICGQALRGGNDTPTNCDPETYRSWLRGFAEENSPWWRFILQLMMKVLKRHYPDKEFMPGDLLAHFGWTNLALIESGGAGNPHGPALSAQKQLCIEAMNEAIDTMQPTGILMLTGPYSDDLMNHGCGTNGRDWRALEPSIPPLEVCIREDGIPVYWSYHPNGLNYRGLFRPVIDRLAQEL